MSETIVVQDVYIQKLEEYVANLTKNKLILETNSDVLNKIIDQRNKKIDEINSKNLELNETIGKIQEHHQKEIEDFKFQKNEEIEKNNLEKKQEINNINSNTNQLLSKKDEEIKNIELKSNELVAELYQKINDKQWLIDQQNLRIEENQKEIAFLHDKLKQQALIIEDLRKKEQEHNKNKSDSSLNPSNKKNKDKYTEDKHLMQGSDG